MFRGGVECVVAFIRLLRRQMGHGGRVRASGSEVGGSVDDLAHAGEPETSDGDAGPTRQGAGFGFDGEFKLFIFINNHFLKQNTNK